MPHVSHVEWRVTDLDRSIAFFEALFGWRFARHSTHYRIAFPDQGPAVGLLETREVRPSDSTLIHIRVDDLDAYLRRARGLGAPLATPRTAVPGHGWYAQVVDPDGNIVGLFEAEAETSA
ncbi:MAG: VOC family protein [Gammaproteobacteria bacterium]